MKKNWDANQELEVLLVAFRHNFLTTHGYNMVYVPTPITKEWVIDQLRALDWYCAYDFQNKAPEPTKEIKKKPKAVNPFK